jgi:DNA polymerase III epsilon subunit-like protein
MSLPDYSKMAEFYGLLNAVNNQMASRDDALAQAKAYIAQVKSDTYADLYATLSAEAKAELDAIEAM